MNNCKDNQNKNACCCQQEKPEHKGCDVDINVCGNSTKLLPMLQTYTTKVLQPNICCKKSILTQKMVNCEGYKYVIKWDFDLNGKTILVPENCILEFDGGTLSNGTIIGQDTYINDVGGLGVDVLFGNGITREGTWRMNEGGGSSGGGIPDKEYNPDAHSGLGRKTLQLKDGSNVLTQEDFDAENTIYVIGYDFDLNKQSVIMPSNSVLEFDGGSLNNGTIVLDDVDIHAGRYQIFGDDLTVVSYTKELDPNTGHFQPVKKRTLYASWFGLGDDGTHNPDGNNADKFEKAVETLKNNGKLIVDTNIYIERPVVVRDLFYTIIEGEVGNDSINVCIPHIYSGYIPNEGTTTNLFEFYSEGLQLRNIKFAWGLNESDTGGGLSCNSVLYIRPNGGLAEIDCVIEECQIDSYKFGDPINAKGRGLYIRNNVIHHPFLTGSYRRAMIRLVGYYNNDDRDYFRAKDANRATVIQNNRFHVGFNNYIVWFEQDPDNSESTFSNTIITGNLCDIGCYGIYSESRIRNLIVSNNAFSVMALSDYPQHYQFNYFKNSVNGFNFTGNALSVIEDANAETIARSGGETWFEYPAKVEGKDYDVKFENINISCNTYDVYNMSCIARFDGRNGASDTAYPILKQICISNNTLSDRCLSGGSASSVKSIVTIVNCSLNNVAVMGNAIRRVGDYNTYTANLINAVNSQYPAKNYSYKDVIFSLNSGVYNDIHTDKIDKTYWENVITTTNLRPLISSVAWGYRDDTTISASIFDVNLNKQLWWDNKRWIDNNGYSGAKKRGTTNERPTKYLIGNDSGFRYFDTDLGKDIIYKNSAGRWPFDHENTVEDEETHIIKFDALNTLEKGALYLLSINTGNNEHHLYFYNSESPETKIDVIEEARTQGYTTLYNMLTQFEAPDPTVYDRILITTARETEFSIVEYNTWWEEEDGAKAGVRRSGTFAQAPTLASDIYNGFMYMLVDGASRFPIYAVISDNSINWYKADGTQYIGS